MNMVFKRKLPTPAETKELYPIGVREAAQVAERIEQAQQILSGESDRLLLIVGPCSADHEDSVMEYLTRLARLQERVQARLLLVPRLYTNKPRTSGAGYQGMVYQPDPEAQPDLFKGITAMRKLHMRAVQETGLACADEMLYPELYKYIDDLACYMAVGARSVENQQHRLTASAADCPVGMKNPPSGDLRVLMHSISAAQQAHDFIYRGWEGRSYGNSYSHAILRGYTGREGISKPNYDAASLHELAARYAETTLAHPALVIDCNHANSGKNPFAQPRILKEALQTCRQTPELRSLLKGFMIESYLKDGSQPVDGGVYGKSITDACLGWDKSERLILETAELLA